MSRWPTAPLRRLFRVVNGGTPTSDAGNWNGGVRWATPVDLGRVDGGLLADTDRTLSADGLTTGSRLVDAGSLIVSTRAPIGYAATLIGRSTSKTNDAIARLVDVGILRQRNPGRQRGRVFEAPEVIEMFSELERSLSSRAGSTAVSASARPVPARPVPARPPTSSV